MAARLQAITVPNSVLVSEETRHLAGRSYAFVFEGSKELKGFAAPEKVWRALGHKVGVDRFYAFGRMGGPLINREDELKTIGQLWDGVLAGQGSVVLIEGDAGIGKSRLLREVRRRTRAERSRLLFFQCLPGGFRSTLHPLLNNIPESVSGSGGQMGPTAAAVAALFERNGIRDAEVVDVFSYLLGAQGSRLQSNEDPKAIREKAHRAMLTGRRITCVKLSDR